MIFDSYPYTDFHEMNLDFILRLAKDSMGLHLDTQGNSLVLKNASEQVVSSVTVTYADKALKDAEGNEITAYIMNVESSGTAVVFTRGDGTTKSIVVPYATKALNDKDDKAIEDYVFNAQISGDKLRITKGDGTVFDLTIPFATKAQTDVNGKGIVTYAANLVVDGDKVRLNDATGTQIASVTVPFATKAAQDSDGSVIKESYASALRADSTTISLIAKDGTVLNSITVPVATHALNAIETVTISGNQVIFSTYDGQTTIITIPYAVKASQDELGNVLKTTYIADVVQDNQNGEIVFKDATGGTVCTLTPVAATAIEDNYGNEIADYIKTIAVSQNSNYVTVTHGTGDTDTIVIHYAEVAWKDTNGNVIKNTYVKREAIVESPAGSGNYYLVCYNGDTPEAELFRIKLVTVVYDDVNYDISITIGGN